MFWYKLMENFTPKDASNFKLLENSENFQKNKNSPFLKTLWNWDSTNENIETCFWMSRHVDTRETYLHLCRGQ